MRPELITTSPRAATTAVLRELLLLVGEDVPLERMLPWAPLERAVVEDWARREHLHASDNLIRRRPRPSLLGERHG